MGGKSPTGLGHDPNAHIPAQKHVPAGTRGAGPTVNLADAGRLVRMESCRTLDKVKVYDLLRQRILVSSTQAVDELGLTWPTVQAALERLEKMEIVREVSGKKRNRLYQYTSHLRILSQGA